MLAEEVHKATLCILAFSTAHVMNVDELKARISPSAARAKARRPPRKLQSRVWNAGHYAEDGMSLFRGFLVAAIFCTAPAFAADPGGAETEHQCAACHQVTPHPRNELADAPAFDLIGGKNGFDAAALASALLGPHPKMNFSPEPARCRRRGSLYDMITLSR